MQRATLATLRAFGAFAQSSMTQPAAQAQPAAAARAHEATAAQPPEPGEATASSFDASGWWNLLQSQFNQIAQFAMTQQGQLQKPRPAKARLMNAPRRQAATPAKTNRAKDARTNVPPPPGRPRNAPQAKRSPTAKRAGAAAPRKASEQPGIGASARTAESTRTARWPASPLLDGNGPYTPTPGVCDACTTRRPTVNPLTVSFCPTSSAGRFRSHLRRILSSARAMIQQAFCPWACTENNHSCRPQSAGYAGAGHDTAALRRSWLDLRHRVSLTHGWPRRAKARFSQVLVTPPVLLCHRFIWAADYRVKLNAALAKAADFVRQQQK